MKVIFSEQYKSIKSLPDLDLPDFTILTGVNGSGKTHMLEGISSGHIRLEIENRKVNSIIHFDYQNFIFQHSVVQRAMRDPKKNAPNEKIKKLINKSEIEREVNIARGKVGVFLDNQYDDKKGLEIKSYIYRVTLLRMLRMPMDYIDGPSAFNRILEELKEHSIYNNRFVGEHIIMEKYFNSIYFEVLRSMKYIQKVIEEDPLVNKYYFAAIEAGTDLISFEVGQAVYSEDTLGEELMKEFRYYRHQQFLNDVKKARRERDHCGQHLSEEAFRVKHGIPPWELLNQVLKEYGCNNYLMPIEQLPYPDPGQKIEDFYIPLDLVNQCTNQRVDSEDLSSGEKTLLALVLVVYRQKKKKQISLSDVLLLDEIDGNLHPSMIEKLLNVLKNIFIKEYGMKIILVTHSPTTIALAPDRSVFIMHRDGSSAQRIEQKDRGDALDILTEGYATLDKGLRLFDQISRKKISIITEGRNADYLMKANKFFGDPSEIEIITGAEGNSGKNQLKTLYDFFMKVSHKNKVFFVWDCDAEGYGRLERNDTTVPYAFRENNENSKVRKGIENLFLQELTDKFYADEKIDDSGNIFKRLDKNKLQEHLIANGNRDDFIKFKPLFEDIKKELKYKSK